MSSSTQFRFAAIVPVPIWTLFLTAVRAVYVNLIKDNPVLWSWRYGSRNLQADVEGPAYIISPPDRQLKGEDGRVVLATEKHFKEWTPFLLSGSVVDPDGAPVAGAEITFWQADPTGSYAVRTYNLRGKFRTAHDGSFQILTVWPAPYGLGALMRASHFHLMITSPPNGLQYRELTSQLYVCPNNDPRPMKRDFISVLRTPRTSLMLESYLVSPATDSATEMPALPTFEPAEDPKLAKAIQEWNGRLAGAGHEKQVGAAAGIQLRLSRM